MRRYYHSSSKILRYITSRNIFSPKNLLKLIWIFLIFSVIGFWLLWIFFLRGIPDISSIERWDYFEENTVIYDIEKNPIYTLFNEWKRTYIPYTEISDTVKNAVISIEDKTFFDNPGIDIMGLARVSATYITWWKYGRLWWASTISQQLIKNTLLTKEHSIKRKVQEAYLSYKLNKTYSKEKILEMYLNTISFGHNANGVEQASLTFFWKSVKNVWPLGATILASLPNGPTKYSPYMHRDRLMWMVEVYPTLDTSNRISIISGESRTLYAPLYKEFRSYLSGITLDRWDSTVSICGLKTTYIKKDFLDIYPLSLDDNGCSTIAYDLLDDLFGNISFSKDINIKGITSSYTIEYTIGRKDLVALRMLEDGAIDGATFKKIIYDGIEFEFKKYTENIRYPYFVMYVKEYLESKYGKDIDITKWLKVYTTINPKLQNKAEELVKKQVSINTSQYGARSAALISMDNKNGGLLAMVGWPDYFDLENGGNNNMTLAKRQPGSSFKPIVYALALSKYPIWPESPIADVKTSFWKWNPDNYDKSFKGIMPLRKALGYSRNIPAIKMFYLGWKEEEIVKIWKEFGLSTLQENAGYGAPVAIGTAEVRPIDLMQAYSIFANLWIKRDVHAIEKIEDSDGNTLEEYTLDKNQTPIFSPAASYIINKILSDTDARPEGFWRNALAINGRIVAAKTGTSNKEISPEKILPRDLWTAWYTPQLTTVVWAGNVDGKETKWNCDGLNCAAAIWKPFMEYALKDLPKEDWKKPDTVYSYTIARMSGKLATEETPEDQKVATIMAVKLSDYDTGMKSEEIDTLCNGPVTEKTPLNARGRFYIPNMSPIIDGYDPAWTSGFFQAINGSASGINSVIRSTLPCERPESQGNINLTIESVWINNDLQISGKKIIEGSWNGDRLIQKITLKNGENTLITTDYATGKLSGSVRINTLLEGGEYLFSIEVIDIYGFSYKKDIPFFIWWVSSSGWGPRVSNNKKPLILLTNPRGLNPKISLYEGDLFNLRFSVQSSTPEREVTLSIDGKVIQSSSVWELFIIPISSSELEIGTHKLTISVFDGNLQNVTQEILLSVLAR